MSSNVPVVGEQLRDKLSSRVREALFDLLPEEDIKQLIDKEIHAFFEEEEKFEVEEIPSQGYYSPKRVVLHTSVAPFRRLVRSLLWEQIRPLVETCINDVDASYKQELNSWFGETFRGEIEKPMALRIDTLALQASKAMALSFVDEAADRAKNDLLLALQASEHYSSGSSLSEKLRNSWPIKPV